MPPRTLMEYLQLASGHLKACGIPTHRLDAEVLLAHILNLERIQLYIQHDRPLTTAEVDAYRRAIARRAHREPVAYITGKREFFSIELLVDRRCLIPRPETEILVETALEEIRRRFPEKPELKVADIGTGSGAIAISVAKHEPRARVTAVDIDRDALDVAVANVRRTGVADRVTLKVGELLTPLGGELYDAILSNPPYISEEEWRHLAPDVRDYEPRRALVGGEDGLAVIRQLIQEAKRNLAPGGFLALEIGASQGDQVVALAQASGYAKTRLVQDLAGLDRVVILS
ncbi:MAG TPA: peptide chain release factor N(5)-glutamine methyltransferase [Limnochordia bacterium]|nr:peptide chain release factor N(5)-glutamine methyltransferase [Limnochordia bacterium]